MINLTIAILRKEKNVTQKELANYLGVSFQSVSKWENGMTMPDISLLPLISEYFGVTTDEILGLKPLKNPQYIFRDTDSNMYWNKKLEYLKYSRIDMWNDDYLELLINKVWKIKKPVKIVDFGCGYGYLGMKLLPLLPEGSTYTGIDISSNLIEEAELIFSSQKFETHFIHCDVNTYSNQNMYDIAICQDLLRYLPNPLEVLSKMIDVVKTGGTVICIEVNRAIGDAGLYIHDYEYNPSKKSSILQKNWNCELESEGRDFSIGQKLPCYMQELGLVDVGIRMNDSVAFINPSDKKEKYLNSMNSIKKTMLWDKPYNDKRKNEITKLFMSRGMSKSEIESYINIEAKAAKYVEENSEVSIVKTSGLLISYGKKAKKSIY